MSIDEINRLKNKKINVNNELILAIKEGKDKSNLVRIAYAIRYGADTNLYVDVSGVGKNFHILGYAYKVGKIYHDDYLNTIILLLLVGGSSLSKPAFKKKKTKIPNKEITIAEWLEGDGYSLARQYIEDGYKNVAPQTGIDFVATLLDIPDLVKNPKNELIAKTIGENMLSKYKLSNEMVFWDIKDMKWAVQYFNLPLFNYLLKLGIIPTYPMINNILIRAGIYKNKNEFNALIEIIKLIIKNGIELDYEQLNLLHSLDENLFKEVKNIGNSPYWKKVCSQSEKIKKGEKPPQRLQRTAKILGITQTDFKNTCLIMKKTSQTDKDQLKASLRGKKNDEFQSKLKYPNELIINDENKLKCEKPFQKQGEDQSNYSDLHVSSYRCNDGKVWCFTSEYYSFLLSEKKNYHKNGEKLPNEFIKEIKFKLDILKELGFIISEPPPTITETVDELYENDKFGNNVVDEKGIINKLQLINLNKLTPTNAEKIFQIIGASTNIDRLSGVHARLTTLWILDWLYDNNKEQFLIVKKEIGKL